MDFLGLSHHGFEIGCPWWPATKEPRTTAKDLRRPVETTKDAPTTSQVVRAENRTIQGQIRPKAVRISEEIQDAE